MPTSTEQSEQRGRLQPLCFVSCQFLPSGDDDVDVIWLKLNHAALALDLLAGYQRRAAATEAIENDVALG